MGQNLQDLFSANLQNILNRRGFTQADLSRSLGVSTATASDWANGRKLPRAYRLQALCEWLGVDLAELLGDANDDLYKAQASAMAAQEIINNPALYALFSAARDSSPENILLATQMLERMKNPK